MCFQDSSTPTRSLTGSLCAAVAILVGWCVWTCWEKRKEEPPIPPFSDEEEHGVVDDSDRKGLLSSEKEEIRPSLLGRFMNLPSVLKVREKVYRTDKTGV
jgi:hypothetical protein